MMLGSHTLLSVIVTNSILNYSLYSSIRHIPATTVITYTIYTAPYSLYCRCVHRPIYIALYRYTLYSTHCTQGCKKNGIRGIQDTRQIIGGNTNDIENNEKTSATKVILEAQWGICSAPCVLCKYTVVCLCVPGQCRIHHIYYVEFHFQF